MTLFMSIERLYVVVYASVYVDVYVHHYMLIFVYIINKRI